MITDTAFEETPTTGAAPDRVRIAILGGGIAGVTVANELSKSDGIDVTLIEKEEILGGLHRTTTINGCTYDIGTFVFWSNHEMFTSFPGIGDEFARVDYLPSAIRRSGSLDAYPLSLGGYIRDFGVTEAVLSGFDLLLGRLKHRKRDTLPTYIRYYTGDRIYINSGLKRYIERLYHTEDSNIDIIFAKQRLDMLESHLSMHGILDRIRIRLQRKSINVGQSLQSYVRPTEGFSRVYGEIHRRLDQQGVRVLTGTEITSISKSDNGFTVEFPTHVESFDRIISTIPITTLAGYLGMDIDARFEYMKLISLYYRFRGDAGFPAHVLFNYTNDGLWKRLTRFSEYYGRYNDDEYFAVEATAIDCDEQHVDIVREDFQQHVRQLGLFNGALSFQGYTVTDHAYPLFHLNEIRKLDEARKRIREFGIDLIGRQGNFEYITSLVAALKSKAFAQELRSEVSS